VLLDAGEGHVEVGGQVADGSISPAQTLDDASAGGIGQAAKAVSSRSAY